MKNCERTVIEMGYDYSYAGLKWVARFNLAGTFLGFAISFAGIFLKNEPIVGIGLGFVIGFAGFQLLLGDPSIITGQRTMTVSGNLKNTSEVEN